MIYYELVFRPIYDKNIVMKSEEIRSKFIEFFRKRGHAILPSASLVPENDPSVLFTTAGMQPLVPYLLGEKHPMGDKIANVQKCVRTQDIEEVGDNTHDTFFEMLGNWSLGSYFKEDAIKWSYEFLFSDEGLGLDPNRLYITVFAGNEDAPRDDESFETWKKLGIRDERIYFMSADKNGKEPNWWSPGDNGPCGPDTEMFYDVTEAGLGDLTKEEYMAADERQDIVEIWNDVFMEYQKKDGKVIGKLNQKNVDTGAGLERLTMVMQKKDNIFETDLFAPLISEIRRVSNLITTPEEYISNSAFTKAERVLADHIRTSAFMIADGIRPSNKDRGYILRRLLRRAMLYAHTLSFSGDHLDELAKIVIEKYKDIYPNIKESEGAIMDEIIKEKDKFKETLKNGLKEFEKVSEMGVSGEDAFILFTTYGFPIEMTLELASGKGVIVDLGGFYEQMKIHQELSRTGAEKKFQGGLADTSEMSVKYHTATHLLHRALKDVLGDHIAQKGSNITPERLRFDFSHDNKMTDEEIKKVEDLVNKKIEERLPVNFEELPIKEAEERGAVGLFGGKYGDVVKVYRIGDGSNQFSIELCGGPHVKNTGELGRFKISKEEAVSSGVRRIKAVLE